MADGSTKPIEQVAVGDEVLAADPETGQIGPRTVTAEITGAGEKNLVAVTIGEATITATDEHPFWSPESGEWTHATDLKPGQLLELPDRTHAPVTTLHRWTQPSTVHNLTIEGLHTYYVLAGETPVLVHNSNGSCGVWQSEFDNLPKGRQGMFGRCLMSRRCAIPSSAGLLALSNSQRGAQRSPRCIDLKMAR
ncbi:polymorphic toxin-type HINT domain-containing protein [Streptomyces sp. SM12]|uniref:polymorphic toxin-type HINT domain-containing protein n=1 Tax=Streptomyces sp. SM12 TaxID=1071602 RepID=UPI000CD4ED43|nr:polymorphic toxin-type HINT domain-containing protein [Streptomyces sp. SM12]